MGCTEFLSLPTALMACGQFASFAQFAAQIDRKYSISVRGSATRPSRFQLRPIDLLAAQIDPRDFSRVRDVV